MQQRPRLRPDDAPRPSAFGTAAEDHFRTLRRNVRRELLIAVSETIGIAAWSERQDRVFDIIDRELHSLVTEAGGSLSEKVAQIDPGAEPSDDLEALLAQTTAARGEPAPQPDDVPGKRIPARFMPPE